MDIIAAALKIDPLELRLKNGYVDGDRFVTEEKLRSVGLRDCLEAVAKSIGWEEEQPINEVQPFKLQVGRSLKRGKGLACMIKATITPSISCAALKLNEDSSLSLYSGTVEMGQGSETVLAQIAGEELGIPLRNIQVLGVDTDVVPL